MEDGIMTLDQGRIGKSYTVAALLLPPRMERRLESLGMTEGTSIDVLNNKNCGRLIIKVRGQGRTLHLVCTRDFLLGVAWAIVPFAFPVFFYFVGRAYFRALTWRF